MINSQPSSTPCGNEVKDADEYEKYQETELFEDTLVLNSPFSETEMEKLNLDTEVIEDSDPLENMITGITCEYEPEVVLDSEDEGMNVKSAPTVARGFLGGGTNSTVKNSSMLFQKRWPKLPREQVDSNATTNGKSAIGDGGASIDAESFDDNKHLYLLDRLNPTHSAKPRDSTQAALGFVDQYLSSSQMDLFQGTQYRNTFREKSPHVLSVRGSLCLAKKIKARTRNEVKEPFNWADSNQNDKETGISHKKVKASSNVRSYAQTYKRRQKKGNHLQKNQNQGNCSNRCDESLVQGPIIATENDNSLKDLDVETCSTKENVNIYSNVSRTEDMSDIGLDTQIAAEAMDALAYPSPPGFHFNDAHRQEDAFDGSMSDVKQAHQKSSSCSENLGLHSVTLKSNNRNTYKRRQKKGNHLLKNQNQGNCSNRCDESLVQGPIIATENENSLKDLDVETCATKENVNIYSNVSRSEDMSDIGLDTQIAAEAMDALAYPPSPGFHFNDAHRQEDAFDGSMSDVKQSHQKNTSCREILGLHSIAPKSNNRSESSCRNVGSRAIRENVHICSSVALTEDMSDIGLDTQIAAEAMDALAYLSPLGSHSSGAHQPEDAFDGSSSDLKQAHQKSSCTDNPGLHSIPLKSNKRNVSFSRFSIVTSTSSLKRTNNQESSPGPGKTKKLMGSKSSVERRFKNNTSLSICREGVSREGVCLSEEYTSFQSGAQEPKTWNKSSLTRIKEQPSHHKEKNNDVEETGIIRYKRKGNCLLEDPVKLDIKTKCLKLPTNSGGVARQNRLYPQVQISPQLPGTGSFSSIDSWAYPKGPRGKRKRANAPKILRIDAKRRNVYSTRSPEGQDDVQPFLLAHVEISSNKNVAQLSSEISAAVASRESMKISNAIRTYNEHHKKPFEKNLPRTSLLKELISLGVPTSTSDMTWKDLRHRRDMTHVRVLFSQHLNDSVIKQQKKILSRFNISIASTSMEATHFIADKFTRTKNMLEAMALGKLVVTHLWLESCGQANCFIDEKNYILRDMKKEKEIGFSMPVSLSQARQKPLLKGKRVYITPHIKPIKEVVASLVTAVHGQLVDQNQIYAHVNDKILDDLLILSCEEDNAICCHFLKKGVSIYSSELLLNGIVTQKLELERHKLFVNQVTRYNPSMFNRFGKVYKRRLRSLS